MLQVMLGGVRSYLVSRSGSVPGWLFLKRHGIRGRIRTQIRELVIFQVDRGHDALQGLPRVTWRELAIGKGPCDRGAVGEALRDAAPAGGRRRPPYWEERAALELAGQARARELIHRLYGELLA